MKGDGGVKSQAYERREVLDVSGSRPFDVAGGATGRGAGLSICCGFRVDSVETKLARLLARLRVMGLAERRR